MKKLLFIPVVFLSAYLFAGQPDEVYFKNSELLITKQTESCNNSANGTYREYIFLKLENLTDKKMEVSFKKELWYNEQCTTCEKNNDEYLMKIVLNPKESISGNCDLRQRALSVFSKMLDKSSNSSLTKFELKNIQIKTID